MYEAAGHSWQQVEKHGMTSPVTLITVWGRYKIQGLHDVLSIWLFTFPFPGHYADKCLLLSPGLCSLYFRPLSVMSKIQIPSGLVWRWLFRLVYFVWGDGSILSWVTCYPDWRFLWFSSVLSSKFIGSTSIWSLQVSSKSIHICHSMAILP